MELRLNLPETVLLAAFVLCSLALFALVGWLAARRLRQRGLYRRALKAAQRADHAAAFRFLAAAERCWLPATLHPTAGNCQRSLEEYAEIVARLAVEAEQLGAAVQSAALGELIEKRIGLINRALFADVPKGEIEAVERAFEEERERFQRAYGEGTTQLCGPANYTNGANDGRGDP